MPPAHSNTAARAFLWAGLPLIAVLAALSLFVGVSSLSPAALWAEGMSGRSAQILFAARLPRTLALMLAGAGMAMAGLVMQILVRNRFVEPSTVGTTEAAGLGILLVMLFVPDLPVFARMLVAAVFGLAGTALFLAVLRAVPLRSTLMVPLIGILLSGVIGAVSTFIAYRYDFLQSLTAWMQGDFSIILRGRYEMLWLALAMLVALYFAADRFTVAGLGKELATSLGLNHRAVVWLGLGLVALISAAVVATVGNIPFLGLVVPNIVSLMVGDNTRRSLPLVVMGGAGMVLACDIVGRVVIRPYEIPIGTTMGVIGSAVFLFLLLRGRNRVA
ncbi:ABC transporter permease [Pararhodobacter sp.]|uniref:ABC transporter permease n=1 Tax=Pararhodobacter sp. TaxID=2127056 RepID=UPI002FDC941D